MNIAHDERHSFLLAPIDLALPPQLVGFIGRNSERQRFRVCLKSLDPEMSPTRGEVCLGYLLDLRTSHVPIISCTAPMDVCVPSMSLEWEWAAGFAAQGLPGSHRLQLVAMASVMSAATATARGTSAATSVVPRVVAATSVATALRARGRISGGRRAACRVRRGRAVASARAIRGGRRIVTPAVPGGISASASVTVAARVLGIASSRRGSVMAGTAACTIRRRRSGS